VQSVAWLPGSSLESSQRQSACRDRLISAGLNGRIVEWDLLTLTAKASTDAYGGGVWALALSHSGSKLAAACEDG
jgi:hypothetical protein